LKEATWSFEMSRNILLAALALATFSFPARADSFDPKTSGAVYGKLDLETAKANDEAVASTIEKIAKSGGGDLILTGSLAITQSIEPPTIVFNGTAGYPMHFGIRGDILAELVDVDGGVAINFPAPTFPGNLPGYELRQPIRDLGVRGGGIVIGGGGKFITLRRVSIYAVQNCPIALSVAYYDGGHLEDVNIYESPNSTGFKIVKSHHTFVDITSRSNAVGGIITGSVLFGSLICESNSGDGLVCDDVSRSSLACWCEGNKGRMAVFTNCFLNVFTAGKLQADSNEVILDTMSRNLNKWPDNAPPGREEQQANTDKRLRPEIPAWAFWAYPPTWLWSAFVANCGVWCFIFGYLHWRGRRNNWRWLLVGGLCLSIATLGLLMLAFAFACGHLF
jgi:hypothetical protein